MRRLLQCFTLMLAWNMLPCAPGNDVPDGAFVNAKSITYGSRLHAAIAQYTDLRDIRASQPGFVLAFAADSVAGELPVIGAHQNLSRGNFVAILPHHVVRVVLVGSRPQMSGVDAGRVVTSMAYERIANVSIEDGVRDTVSVEPPLLFLRVKNPVTAILFRPPPYPAMAIRKTAWDKSEESLNV